MTSRPEQQDIVRKKQAVPRGVWAVALLLAFGIGTSAAQERAIGTRALQQIDALLTEKNARTAEQKKIDSRLLLELRRQRGEALVQALPSTLRRFEGVAADGTVLVDLQADVDPGLLFRIDSLGGEVEGSWPRFDSLRVRLPLDRLEALAESSAVRSIRPAAEHFVHGNNTTEGDVAHGTDLVRAQLGVDGTGVSACAMSDSVDALADLQASGDLPNDVTVLPGQSGNPGSSEGTALLEILFDMAPGADLFFATGCCNPAQMAQNILDLQAAGCDVIVDDIGYFVEPVFQDGVIAQAVDTVVAAGTHFFSAAGNSGNLDSGTSGVWEGTYVGTALPPPLNGAGLSAHDFGGDNNSNEITEQALNDARFFTLQWSDPIGGASNDYDLFLLDETLTNVLQASTNVQDGDDDPLEILASQGTDDTGHRLVIVKFGGDDRFLHLNTHRGFLEHATDGQIFGHPAAEGALAVAAVNVATAGGGQFTGGPANPVEVFSSDGPRRIFFDAAGNPVPASGGEAFGGQSSVVRQKPDIAAADGVTTATPGFDPFFGTSASAPHAAAISALFQELFPSVSQGGAYDVFRSTALDIDDEGFDRNSGSGILMMPNLVDSTIFADGFESGNTSAWTK